MIIEDILARKIFDSRGNPTIEVDVYLDDGSFGRAVAPAGASTGTYEAVVIPVDDAIAKLETEVADQLVGENATDQEEIDALLHEIDGTENFGNIGGNAAVAVSMATAWAAAGAFDMPLYRYLGGPYPLMPYPLGNVIGGGAHAKGATDIQEFLVTPVGAPTIEDAVLANTLVHKRVKKLLTDSGIVCGKGDEGGWAPQIKDARAFEIVSQAVREISDEQGFEIRFGLDVAASELWDGKQYVYKDAKRTRDEQIDYLAGLIDQYDLYYVEDPLEENDFEGFAKLTDMVGDRCIICGDDLFVTNARAHRTGHRRDCRERCADQAQPDRHGDRHVSRDQARQELRLQLRDVPPERRILRLHHLAPRGRFRLRAAEDRRRGRRADGEAERADSHRRRDW